MTNKNRKNYAPEVTTRRRYKFRVKRIWLTMPDGIRLAASCYIPVAKHAGETFPVLLEYLPYRKDDTFYVVDHPFFSYQAQLGFFTVKVDIRGTGASEGDIPEREYSDVEMQDCEEIIKQLAANKYSNGNVGMFGVSWSGFNAIQMAMRRPPALKAIHAVHASDDLYQDDLDPYHLYICHELALPRTPAYKFDKDYFAQKFNHRPWLFTYLNNQLDGPFWQKKSLRQDFGKIDIPVYLVGGLLDGYRTATMRMFKELKVPVRCEIGPWDHSCPDEGAPGPNYEWQKRLAEWFNRYLRPDGNEANSANRGNADSNHKNKELIVYVRHGHEPDINQKLVPGYWRDQSGPARAQGGKNLKLFLSMGKLQTKPKARASGHTASGAEKLQYQPFAGTAAGTWWGNTTGDMAADDAHSLVFDSAPMRQAKQIIGLAKVSVAVSASSAKAKWSVRLEDLAPDGGVTLITGALFNPAQGKNRLEPKLPRANEVYLLKLALQFTTWTFQPGHKIRLAISNAQFPMAWPSPEPMVSTVFADGMSASLTLPVVPADVNYVKDLPALAKKQNSPDSWSIDFGDGKPARETFNRVDKRTGACSYVIKSKSAYVIDKDKCKRTYFAESTNTWTTSVDNPGNSSYLGLAQTTIVSRGKRQRIRTRILVQSNESNFYVTVTRTVFQNGKLLKRRRFVETIERQFQ